jgi:uncharacterized protein YhjY with autotransporter beta-barrel domain
MKLTSLAPFACAAILLALSTGKLMAAGPNPISTAGLNPNQAAIAKNINSGNPFVVLTIFPPFFAPTPGKASALAFDINALPASARPGALDQLSPEEFGRFTSVTAFNNASFETQAMDDYLASRRDQNGNFFGGSGSIDASGLVLGQPGYDPNMSSLHSRLLALNQGPSAGTVSDVTNPLFGGTDSKDMKDMKSVAGPCYTNPWNFFVRGGVVLAQGLSQPDVAHFDGNTESVVLGTDYRIDPNLLVGLTLGYGHTDVTLDTANSSATVDSYSPGLYASYADKGWYADVTGNYVYNTYTQERNISFLAETANSATQGNEGVANIDGGYDFHQGALTYGPLAGLQYTHLSVNSYSESGAPLADLNVQDQESDSLRSRLGGRVSYTLNFCGLCFQPHLEATWQHEFMDQSRGITSQFESAGLGSFSVTTENPSRDFALADVGFDLKINRSITAFTDYEVEAGQANYFGQSVQAGITIGF